MALNRRFTDHCTLSGRRFAIVGTKALHFPNSSDNLNAVNMDAAYDVISGWVGYAPTPLVRLDQLPRIAALRCLLQGQITPVRPKIFQALGGAYAVAKLVAAQAKPGCTGIPRLPIQPPTVIMAGQSPGAAASRMSCRNIHSWFVSQQRADAMAAYGANINRINGNYEASLAACKSDAHQHDRFIVSDTSWRGYRDVPLDIMAGYTVMGHEILQQLGAVSSSHCFYRLALADLPQVLLRRFGAPWVQPGTMIGVESFLVSLFPA